MAEVVVFNNSFFSIIRLHPIKKTARMIFSRKKAILTCALVGCMHLAINSMFMFIPDNFLTPETLVIRDVEPINVVETTKEIPEFINCNNSDFRETQSIDYSWATAAFIKEIPEFDRGWITAAYISAHYDDRSVDNNDRVDMGDFIMDSNSSSSRDATFIGNDNHCLLGFDSNCDSFHDFTSDSRRSELAEKVVQTVTSTGLNSNHSPHISSADVSSKTYANMRHAVNVVKLVEQKITSNKEVMEKLSNEKIALEKTLTEWLHFSSTFDIARKKIAFIKAIEDGSITKMLTAIQASNIKIACALFRNELRPLWAWPQSVTHLIEGNNKPAENSFIDLLGVNLVKEVESYLALRPDYHAWQGIVSNMRDFERKCALDLQIGNREILKLQKIQLQSDMARFVPFDDPWLRALTRARLAMVESLLAAPLTQICSTIVHTNLPIAQKEVVSIKAQLAEHFKTQNIQDYDDQRSHMIEQEGFDVLTVMDTLLETRPEYIHKPLEPIQRMLSTIKNENINIAQTELNSLKQQFNEHCCQQNVTTKEEAHEYLTTSEGFNVPEFADAFFTSRVDHPSQINRKSISHYENILKETLEQRKCKEIFIAQPCIIEALDQSASHTDVAARLKSMSNQIFYNAAQYDHMVNPQVNCQVNWSINGLSHAPSPEAFIFHLATIEHVLHDVQKQTAVKADITPSLIERSPELLCRFVKQYFEKLNPVTQIGDNLSFLVNSARYLADVTIGKTYLTEVAYKERTQQFWEFVDAIKNIQHLHAEQVIDVVAQLAADMTYGVGIGKTWRYLKEIDAIGRTQRQAAVIANQFKKCLDAALAERPILITAEGIAIQAPKAAEELALLQSNIQKAGGAVKETIKDTKQLLKHEAEIANATKNKIAKVVNRYEDASYHSAKGNSVKSARPINGQKALDNSLKIEGVNSPHRIAVSDGQFVVLKKTSDNLFHGYSCTWKDLTAAMQQTLVKASLATRKGKII